VRILGPNGSCYRQGTWEGAGAKRPSESYRGHLEPQKDPIAQGRGSVEARGADLTARTAGSPTVRGVRILAKMDGAPQRRAFRVVLEERGWVVMMVQSVRVSLLPTLTDTLARQDVGRCWLGAVSEMVTEVRMEAEGKRARRVVLVVLTW
jgi:hypothetical protein